MDDKAPADSTEGIRSISIEIVGLDDVSPQFANLVHVNNDSQSFQLIFSQVMPPILFGPDDRRELFERGTVPAKVVARIVLTPKVMEQTIDVLRTQFERYQETLAQIADRTGEPFDAS